MPNKNSSGEISGFAAAAASAALLSVVFLLGVPRWRPPRLSQVSIPLALLLSQLPRDPDDAVNRCAPQIVMNPSLRERAVGDLLDSVEFLHGAALCAAHLVTCKPPICVRAACHHSEQPKARLRGSLLPHPPRAYACRRARRMEAACAQPAGYSPRASRPNCSAERRVFSSIA